MSVMTFFFAGTNHAMGSHCDTFEQAYNEVSGRKAFFPGPGGKPPNIFVSPDLKRMIDSAVATYPQVSLESRLVRSKTFGFDTNYSKGGFTPLRRNTIGTNKVKSLKYGSQVAGKGWNKNIWYAIQLIGIFLIEEAELTLNIVGHSRGSITVLMLLNDLFYTAGSAVNLFVPGKDGLRSTKKEATTTAQYNEHLRGIWRKRMRCEDLATQGIKMLGFIRSDIANLEVNAFLFDPVAGPDSDTERRQTVPDANNIKRIRVLRMENVTDATLNLGVPRFGERPGWHLLHGGDSILGTDLWAKFYGVKERVVIPLPGSHGAGMSQEKEKTAEKFIGTSLMLQFLDDCNTKVKFDILGRYKNKKECWEQYEALKKKYGGWKGGTSYARSWVNPDNKLYGGWKSGYLNAHHKYLDMLAETSGWK